MNVRSTFNDNKNTQIPGYTLTGIEKGVYYTIRITYHSMIGCMYINPYWEVCEFYNILLSPPKDSAQLPFIKD